MSDATGHFTAGGQLVEAWWNMFLSSLRPILFAGLFCGGAMWIWLAFQVEDDDFYHIGLYDGVIDAVATARTMLFQTLGAFLAGAILFGAVHVPVARHVGKLTRYLATLMPRRVEQDRCAADEYMPFRIAGVPWPWRQETTHCFAMGTTGSSKSTALKDLLAQIRARGQRSRRSGPY